MESPTWREEMLVVKNEDEVAYQDVALHVVQGSCGLQGPSFLLSLSICPSLGGLVGAQEVGLPGIFL